MIGRLARLRNRARLLKSDLFALYHAARDPRTPLLAKAIVFFVVAYTLSPIDVIPDFIPVLGLLDEVILVPLGISLALKLIPQQVMADARARATGTVSRAKRYAVVGVVIVVLLWLAIAALIFLAVRALTPEAR